MTRYFIDTRLADVDVRDADGEDFASLSDAQREATMRLPAMAKEQSFDDLPIRLTASVRDDGGAVMCTAASA